MLLHPSPGRLPFGARYFRFVRLDSIQDKTVQQCLPYYVHFKLGLSASNACNSSFASTDSHFFSVVSFKIVCVCVFLLKFVISISFLDMKHIAAESIVLTRKLYCKIRQQHWNENIEMQIDHRKSGMLEKLPYINLFTRHKSSAQYPLLIQLMPLTT